MTYINLASSTKQARAARIVSSIGSSATMTLYTGALPVSPDYPPSGTALAVFSLPSPAALVTYTVQSCTVVNGGTGGINGAQTITGTTGAGTLFQAAGTVVGGSLVAAVISLSGAYTVPPTLLSNEPVTGGGLQGARLGLVLTGQLNFNPISPVLAIASGTAGYARISNSSGNGIIDLDCGVAASSVLMNSTVITVGATVACYNDLIIEA